MSTSHIEQIVSSLMSIFFLVASVPMVIAGIRMHDDKVKPYRYGYARTPYALDSVENWYESQRAAATPAVVLGVVFLNSGILFLIQRFFHNHISILVPTAIAVAQVVAGIAYLFYCLPGFFPQKRGKNA